MYNGNSNPANRHPFQETNMKEQMGHIKMTNGANLTRSKKKNQCKIFPVFQAREGVIVRQG